MAAKAALWFLTFIGSSVLASPLGRSAQSISEAGPGRISVEAEAVPLASLIDELRNFAPLETVILSPEAEKRPVSLTIQDVALKEAIQAILEAAGVNHTVWGGNGAPFRIYAGLAEEPVGSPTETPRVHGWESLDRSEEPPYEAEASSEELGPDQRVATGGARQRFATGGARRRFATGGVRPPIRLATGDAALATDSALLAGRPDNQRVALTLAILLLGLSLGAALVLQPAKSLPANQKSHRR